MTSEPTVRWVRTNRRSPNSWSGSSSEERTPGPWHIDSGRMTWCGRKPEAMLTVQADKRSLLDPPAGRLCAECLRRERNGEQRRVRARGRHHA